MSLDNIISSVELELTVCRLCIKVTKCAYPTNALSVFLNYVLPDLDLTLTYNPSVCQDCLNILIKSFNFKKMCMTEQKHIQRYHSQSKKTVDLHRLVESQVCSFGESQVWSYTTQTTSINVNELSSVINSTIKINKEKLEKDKFFYNDSKDFHKNASENLVENIQENLITNYSDNVALETAENTNGNLNDWDTVDITESDIEPDIAQNTTEKSDVGVDTYLLLAENENSQIKNCVSSTDLALEIKDITLETANVSEGIIPCVSLEPEEVDPIPSEQLLVERKSEEYNELYEKHDEFFKCNLCHKPFYNKQTVNGHLLAKHGSITNIDKKLAYKIHYCKCCPYRTINRAILVIHMKKVHRKNISKLFRCSHCRYSGKNSKELAEHVKTHKTSLSEDANRKFLYESLKLVDFSPEEYNKVIENMQVDELIQRNGHLFTCTLCQKVFSQKIIGLGHLLNKHREIPDIERKVGCKIHYCNYCSYRTVNNFNMANHLLSKHNKKNGPYNLKKLKTLYCAHCEYSTRNKGNLILHVRSHYLIRPFQCYFCEKSFNQKIGLEVHLRAIHKDEINRVNVNVIFKNNAQQGLV